MRLRNHTDIPDDLVRDIIRAVRPAGIGGFDVRISNHAGKGGAGRAYTRGSAYHDTADPFLVVRIARTDANARYITRVRGAYLPMAIGSRLECLVVILAHELRHLWQSNCGHFSTRRGMVYGSRGRMSERDADAYALQMLRRYRRMELLAEGGKS